jgi:hypothetical protein
VAAEAVDDPPPVGWAMTCVAVMVVPLVVPSTRTGSPVVVTLVEVELVAFRYCVEDASSTVTFWPADVVIVKLDPDTLPTVPAAPPEAGPDRALDPAPPDRGPPVEPRSDSDCPVVAEEDVAVGEGDVARPTDSPITEHNTAAATIHRFLLFESNRRTLDRRAGSVMVPGADAGGDAGGGGGPAPAVPDLPATDGSDVVLDSG